MPHEAVKQRLEQSRVQLAERGVDLFVLPQADAHHVEWLRESANRVQRLCGFGGSYAKVLVDAEGVSLMTSLIYLEAAQAQVGRYMSVIDESACDLNAWLSARAGPATVVGFDPWLHTHQEANGLRALIKRLGATAQACDPNPVDAVLPPSAETVRAAFPHPLQYAGQAADEKLAEMALQARRAGVDAFLLSAPDSICWLLNIRGHDVFAAPLVYAFLLLRQDGSASLFVDPAKIDTAVRNHLPAAVTIRPYGEVTEVFAEPGVQSVGLDFATSADALVDMAQQAGVAVVDLPDPCQVRKAVKNASELDGARACHRRDGLAQVKFWSWWCERQAAGAPPDELEAQARIDSLRAECALFRGVSFQTISAGRSHGSMPHYHSDPVSNVPIDGDGFYLLDSGGQYLDGTTDVTRTFAVGSPPESFRRRYTQVMKGLVAASSLLFPPDARGYQIDAFARRPLWEAGADYPHATGHGVGSFLGVHEGPIRLRTKPDPAPLALGMIMSIEPGYYAAGAFGIRHENLVIVVEAPSAPEGEDRRWCFETLTLCPFDITALVVELMTAEEIGWLDAYHARVWAELSPLLDGSVRDWLAERTRPIQTA